MIRELNLSNAKSSYLPTNPFNDSLFRDYEIFFWLNLLISTIGIVRWCRSLHGSRGSVVLGIVATTSLLVAGGSLVATFSNYWPNGMAIALATSTSLVIAFLAIAALKTITAQSPPLPAFSSQIADSHRAHSLLATGFCVAGLYFFALPIRGYFFWDYVGQEGRFAMQQALNFGSYPPGSFSYPDLPLTYHFGFDGLVAGVASLGDLALDRANVYIGLVLLLLTFFSIRLFVRSELNDARLRSIPADSILLVTMAALFSGGLPFYSGTSDLNNIFSKIFTNVDLRGLWILPPFASYFFQRAFSLGIPIFFCALVVHIRVENAPKEQRVRYQILLSILLAGLSISNTTLAVTLIVYFSFKTVLAFFRLVTVGPINGSSIQDLITRSPLQITILLGCLLLFNGFFDLRTTESAPGAGGLSGFKLGVCGHTESCSSFVVWLILSFGATSFGFIALTKFRNSLILVVSGLLVAFFLDFKGSPDEVKFAVAPRMLVAMSLTAFVTIGSQRWSSLFRIPLIVITLSAISASSVVFLAPLVRDSPVARPLPIARYQSVENVSPPQVVAVDIAKRLPGRSGFVCSPSLVNYCGTYGGLLQFQQDVITRTLFGTDIQRKLDNPLSPDDFKKLGFDYLLVSESDPVWWTYSIRLLSKGQGKNLYVDGGVRLLIFYSD